MTEHHQPVLLRSAWAFSSEEECLGYHENAASSVGDVRCNAVWDAILCWPPSLPNTQVLLPCPPIKGVDPTKMASRLCGPNALWEEATQDAVSSGGWSNYSMCFVPEIKDLMDKLHSSSEEDVEMKMQVAVVGRVIETVGLVVSLTTIIISLGIFSSFRSLRNNKTRIHWHLFVAMKIQLVIRLTLYIDQYIIRSFRDPPDDRHHGIDNTPMVCESFYVLLEYAKTAMFLWMFIEGLYLHNIVTFAVFHDRPNYKFYFCLGWGLPVPMTAVWVVATAILYTDTECWWGYNLSPYFWILEGPRLTVVVTNLVFLLNILRVIINKLQASASSELQQVKKAVKAAIVLLPLLGITNSLQMVHSPLDSNILYFALWTYFSTFLTAFQGFFVAFIYCFLNNEVQATVRKCWKDFLLTRGFGDNDDQGSYFRRQISRSLRWKTTDTSRNVTTSNTSRTRSTDSQFENHNPHHDGIRAIDPAASTSTPEVEGGSAGV